MTIEAWAKQRRGENAKTPINAKTLRIRKDAVERKDAGKRKDARIRKDAEGGHKDAKRDIIKYID
jgi:hypothetical protein